MTIEVLMLGHQFKTLRATRRAPSFCRCDRGETHRASVRRQNEECYI